MLAVAFLIAAFACLLVAMSVSIFECLFIAAGCLVTALLLYFEQSALVSIGAGTLVAVITLCFYYSWCRKQRLAPASAPAPKPCDLAGQIGVVREVTDGTVYVWAAGTLWEAWISGATPKPGARVEILDFCGEGSLTLVCRPLEPEELARQKSAPAESAEEGESPASCRKELSISGKKE